MPTMDVLRWLCSKGLLAASGGCSRLLALSISLALPKSMSFRWPCWSSRMFSGFRSL